MSGGLNKIPTVNDYGVNDYVLIYIDVDGIKRLRKILITDLGTEIVANSRTNTVVTADYTVLSTDRNIIVNNPCIITLPTLATILHFENIDIINNSNGVVTVTSVEDINGENTIGLYPQDALTVQKSSSKYLIK